MYELAPYLAAGLSGGLLGGAVGSWLAVRWLSGRRWRFDTQVRSWEHRGEAFSAGVCYARADDDEPGPEPGPLEG